MAYSIFKAAQGDNYTYMYMCVQVWCVCYTNCPSNCTGTAEKTHPDIVDRLLLLQHLQEGGEKLRPLNVSWSHQQSVNVST